jgi:hypothetical protein
LWSWHVYQRGLAPDSALLTVFHHRASEVLLRKKGDGRIDEKERQEVNTQR